MVGQTISRYKITENWASSKQIVGVRHLFGVVSFSEGRAECGLQMGGAIDDDAHTMAVDGSGR